jgi:hypothetical protein
MTRYDLVDEAVIAATPEEITAALGDEYAGRSHWWLPYLRARALSDASNLGVGDVYDITVNSKGRVDRRAGSAVLRYRIVESEPAGRSVSECVGGDFRGRMETTLEPVDAGRTRIRVRWQMDPHGLMRLFARFVDLTSGHSTVMQEGFRGMERYVASHRQPA